MPELKKYIMPQHKGFVFLYYKHGELVARKEYTSIKTRDRIIDYWKMLYAKAYDNTFLQFAPDADSEAVDIDGTNRKPIRSFTH